MQKGLLTAPAAHYDQFRTYLNQVISTHSIRTIGEEMSPSALGNTAFSIAFHAAEEALIAHVFCDPDRGERKVLGIRDGDASARETEWLRRLESVEFPILFIFGATHVTGFSAKCRNAGISVNVMNDDWEPKNCALGDHTIL